MLTLQRSKVDYWGLFQCWLTDVLYLQKAIFILENRFVPIHKNSVSNMIQLIYNSLAQKFCLLLGLLNFLFISDIL